MVQVRLGDGSVVQVPYPRVPPAPSISADRREEIARQWLISLSQAPNTARIEELAPLVGRFSPRSPLGKIASQFVASNRLPVHEDVITEYLRRQASAHLEVRFAPIGLDARTSLLELIDEHWAAHGYGPTWSQLSKQIGLDRRAVTAALRQLNKAGAVTFTSAPGSLRRTNASDGQTQTNS